MNMRVSFCALAMIAGVAVPAWADGIPNMVGIWSGDATAAFIGKTPHRTPAKDGPNITLEKLPFAFEITEQQEQHFTGKLKIGKATETIIGSIDADGDNGMMIDDDGQWFFEVKAPGRINLCYYHVTPTNKVVGCFPATKTK